ncbi:MAG: ribonuclease H-like domain-containing protein [Anaerolineales bacterium]|nr:ribonuclease H-like domain-containing protein [Anaerolineales bacterium]
MPMNEDLHARLRRLGVTKGTQNLPTPAPSPRRTQPQSNAPALEKLLPHGRLETHHASQCFVVERVYPLHHRHGRYPLGALAAQALPTAALFCQDDRLQDIDLQQLLFIDTETTGLGGAGTLAFMVGTAYFEREALVVRQFFLRDHADEAAMLPLLAEMVATRPGLVTFNGRSFDLPLLDNRYFMNRLAPPHGDLVSQPHIDLLPPARRIWRSRLTSCSLSSLEQNLLEIKRTHEDVPGWAIPSLYNDYLRSGDARPLLGVFYHNHQDMLSMVTLLTQVLHLFAEPTLGHPLDVVGLATWHLKLGQADTAEQLLRLAQELAEGEAATAVLPPLAALLKKQNRRAEAVALWEQMVRDNPAEIDAVVELAKYAEWHAPDAPQVAQALIWTEVALARAQTHQPYNRPLREALLHRQQRLARKLG